MPNQSAMRMIVPRFPGSCTPSSASMISFANVVGSSVCVCGNTANTSCGCCKKLNFLSSSPVTMYSSQSSYCLAIPGGFHASVWTSILGSCLASKSPTTLGPSATNTCSLLRYFFWSNDLIYFIFALLIIIAKIFVAKLIIILLFFVILWN